jgi:hypothetical protein
VVGKKPERDSKRDKKKQISDDTVCQIRSAIWQSFVVSSTSALDYYYYDISSLPVVSSHHIGAAPMSALPFEHGDKTDNVLNKFFERYSYKATETECPNELPLAMAHRREKP